VFWEGRNSVCQAGRWKDVMMLTFLDASLQSFALFKRAIASSSQSGICIILLFNLAYVAYFG
jgi:hypothetical protein